MSMMTVTFMPAYLRASHEAAGGNAGCYPHNGAIRCLMESDDAEVLIEHLGDWAEVRPASRLELTRLEVRSFEGLAASGLL